MYARPVSYRASAAAFVLLATVATITSTLVFDAAQSVAADKDKPDPKAYGQELLEADADPSFETVAEPFPAMKRPREALSVKDHPDEFVVLPDAKLNFMPVRIRHWRGHTPENSGNAYFTLGNPSTWFGKGDSGPAAKRLVDGYLPIVIADFEHDGLKYEQTAVAWSKAMSPDEPLWGFVRLKVTNPGEKPRDVPLRWHVSFGDGDDRKVREVASWNFKLAPGDDKRVYAKLPYLDGYEKAVESSADEFDPRLAEATEYWRELIGRAVKLDTPEQRVDDAYRAWLAYTFTNVDKIDGQYEPHDGSGFYEATFGIMAAKYCNALDMWGYHDEAETYLDSLQKLVSPEGRFFVHFGYIDTGTLLWVMAEHYQLTGDEQWLRESAPVMIRMCDWIVRTRNESKEKEADGALCYGLVSARLGVDNAGTYYSYVTDGALCTGMEAAAEALRDVGMTDEADRIAKEAAAYRKDIERSMARAVTEHNGMKILPVMPDTHKYLKRALYKAHGEAEPGKGYTGHGYYSLFASILLETQFLPASNQYFRLITDLLEKRHGLLMCMSAFGGPGGIDHAFTYGYWINCLERDEVERVLLGFYGSLAYGMSRNTWAGVECTNVISGYNAHTLPHLRSGTQQLRLLRSMLVREEGNTLMLAQAAPQHWFAPGKKVELHEAPTHFGPVSYTITSAADQGRIRVELVPPKRETPDSIQLFVRHPERKPIRRVSLGGKPLDSFDAGSVTLRKVGTEPLTLELHYD